MHLPCHTVHVHTPSSFNVSSSLKSPDEQHGLSSIEFLIKDVISQIIPFSDRKTTV